MNQIKSLFLSRTVWAAIIQLLLAAVATIIFRAQARTITFTPDGIPGLDRSDAARIARSDQP